MTTIRAFFSTKLGTFFQFFKKSRGDLPPLSPSSHVPVILPSIYCFCNASLSFLNHLYIIHINAMVSFSKPFSLGMVHMTSMKIVQFLKIPNPLSIYVQTFSTSLTLDVRFQTPSPSLLVMITNQKKT